MRLGVVVSDFPVLSETFVLREVLGLCLAGHRVTVLTNVRHEDALVMVPEDSSLRIATVPFQTDPASLERAAQSDGIEHLHSILSVSAHRAAMAAARRLDVTFTCRVYSGYDLFTGRDPSFYREATLDRLCAALIVEDEFMRDWLVSRLGADPGRIRLIANIIDVETYRPAERPDRDCLTILAVARFVRKKGLILLVKAFTALAARRPDVRLTLVGRGPEEPALREAARGDPRIEFCGALATADTLPLYADADVFCLPCIQAPDGDADGVPTTVLEAMACGLPVVTSDLLSMPCYVRHEREGLLVQPGDVPALVCALERLCADGPLRGELGRSGRARVEALCDATRNVKMLTAVIVEGRRRLWRDKLAQLEAQRDGYTAERERFYVECRKRAIAYFGISGGRLLDIGCDQGKLRLHLPDHIRYFGCDVLIDPRVRSAFPFAAGCAEALPYRDNTFDSAVLYAVLPHVFDIDAVLAEAARVIRPGGHLYLQECYNDANPIHLNHLSDRRLQQRVAEHFRILSSQPANEYLMWIVAAKPPDSAAAAPLVSVGITAFNRAGVIRRAVDSALRQTHPRVEVIVVDDGSTDGTARILEEYGGTIRLVRHDRNLGRVMAKNRALRASAADATYVALLDSDDYYHPRFVERCVEYLSGRPEVGLVYTDDVFVDPRGRELRRQRAVDPWNLDVWLRTRNIRGDVWLARRELVMRTALMDPAIPLDEDYDLFYQLLQLTTFGHLAEPLVYISENTAHSADYLFELAKCHAANLVKYGFSPEYAYLRARRNPEWIPAIEAGVALGRARRS